MSVVKGIRPDRLKLIDESDSAYNDMCYLCEKYAPLEGLGKYDSEKDPEVTGARIKVHTYVDTIFKHPRHSCTIAAQKGLDGSG